MAKDVAVVELRRGDRDNEVASLKLENTRLLAQVYELVDVLEGVYYGKNKLCDKAREILSNHGRLK